MGLPLVSVVTPTHGRPELLRRAVEIFLAYRYPAKEMIILDDSPTPAGIPRSPLVRYVHLKDRMVLGSKHNLAAGMAQGEIIAHHDDDDFFSPMRLALQVEAIHLQGFAISGFPTRFLREERSGRFFRFRQGIRFVSANPTVEEIPFGFHDGTAAFHRRVWTSGIQYVRARVAQKLNFLIDAVRAGFLWKTLPNEGHFVYSRHDVNTWQFPEEFLVAAAAPSFAREVWFARLAGRAA